MSYRWMNRSERTSEGVARRTFVKRLTAFGGVMSAASVLPPLCLRSGKATGAEMTTLEKRDGLIAAVGLKLSDARSAWRRLDRDALDREFNIERTVPNLGEILQGYARRGETIRTPGQLDVAYGEAPAERLDIYRAAAKDAPVLMYIHGGGWAKSSKEGVRFMADHYASAGVHFVAIDYPLAPHASLPQIVASVRRAYEWVVRNAASFGGDPTRVTVAGNSAGGHLTACVATESWRRRLGDESLSPAAAVAVSGVFDMVPQGMTRHNLVLKMDEDTARRVSPIDFLDDSSPRTRFILAVGGRETPEFVRQTLVFHSALIERGRSADLLFFNGEDHFSLIGRIADPQHPLSAAFIDELRAQR